MAILLVDGMSVLKSVQGNMAHLDRGYAYSFLIQVTSVVKKFKTRGTFICWEGGFKRRTEILPEYKSNRVSSSELLVQQRDELKKLMTYLGCDHFVAPGFEADDAIAFLANTLDEEVIILSGDKDLLQLVNPKVSVYQKVKLPGGGKPEKQLVTHENFRDLLGWENPEQFTKVLCAVGDEVDCIKGLFGYNYKTLTKYFLGMDMPQRKRETLDEFFKSSGLYKRNRELIDLKLVTSLDELLRASSNYNEEEAFNLLTEMQFASITKKFEDWISTWRKARLDADIPAIS